MGSTRTLAILSFFVLCSPVSAVVRPIGIGQVQLPTSTSTGTGSVLTTTTLIGACDGALACPTAPSSPDVTVVILPAPSSTLISTPPSSDSSVLPSPSNSSSYLLSSSSTLFSTPMPSISISPMSQAAAGTIAAVKDEAASHRRAEALVGGIAGGLSLLALLVITGAVLRRRRLQRDRRDSQFLVDPEAIVVSPFESRESIGFGNGVPQTDGDIAEKALRRHAELERQAHEIQEEMEDLRRVAARFHANEEGEQIAGEIEEDAPPGYRPSSRTTD